MKALPFALLALAALSLPAQAQPITTPGFPTPPTSPSLPAPSSQEAGAGSSAQAVRGVTPGTYVVRSTRQLIGAGFDRLLHPSFAPPSFRGQILLVSISQPGRNARLGTPTREALPASLRSLTWSGRAAATSYLRVEVGGPGGRPLRYHLLWVRSNNEAVRFVPRLPAPLPLPNPIAPLPVDFEAQRVEVDAQANAVILHDGAGKSYRVASGTTAQEHLKKQLEALERYGALPLRIRGQALADGSSPEPTLSISELRRTVPVSRIESMDLPDDQRLLLVGQHQAVFAVPERPAYAEINRKLRLLRRGTLQNVEVEVLIVPSGYVSFLFDVEVLSIRQGGQVLHSTPTRGAAGRVMAR